MTRGPISGTTPDPTVLTVGEACQALRISRWTLYRLIHTRKLATVKIGSRRLIPTVAVTALVEQLMVEESL